MVSSSTIRDFHKNSFWQHHCDGIRKLYTNSGVFACPHPRDRAKKASVRPRAHVHPATPPAAAATRPLARAPSTPPSGSPSTRSRQGRAAFAPPRRYAKGPLDWPQNQVRVLSALSPFRTPHLSAFPWAGGHHSGTSHMPNRAALGGHLQSRSLSAPSKRCTATVTSHPTLSIVNLSHPPLSPHPSQLPNHHQVGPLPLPPPTQGRHHGQCHPNPRHHARQIRHPAPPAPASHPPPSRTPTL